MFRFSKVFIVLLYGIFAGITRGESLDELLEIARRNNAEILKVRAEWKSAMARIPQADSLPDPMIQFEGMGKGMADSEQTIGISQSFPWPGSLNQRKSEASLRGQAAWFAVQAMELRVISQIRSMTIEYAFLEKKKELVQESLVLFKKQEDFLEQTARGGGKISELVRVEMEAVKLSDELSAITEEQIRGIAELSALVGRTVQASEIAVGTLTNEQGSPATHKEDLFAELEIRNPQLQALRNQIDAAKHGVQVARLQTYPEFMLGAGGRRMDDMNEGMVMASVSIPIWKDKNRGIQEEATATFAATQQAYEAMQQSLRMQLESLLSGRRDAERRKILFHDKLLPKAHQSHDVIDASYRSGNASLLDVFDARRRLLEAETGYWRAIADMQMNRIATDALFGTALK